MTKKTDKPTNGKKPWKDLELNKLSVPSATQAGAATRPLQPGEAILFYRNS